jgi:hypothetical protein
VLNARVELYYSDEALVTITVGSNVPLHKEYIEVTSEPGSPFAGQFLIITASLSS